jgi:outer membrane protein assembly factor BamD (BamD/ComL family)
MLEYVYSNCGDILTLLHRYTDAVTAYDHILTDFPEGIFADQAMIKKGQIFELGFKDKAKAVETYQQLLEKFSNSVYANEARKRIRDLRGDNI